MAKTLYALLVGINEYDMRSRIPWLKGCVNDIRGMQDYLEGRVAKDAIDLQLQVLLDSQATRENIIQGFRQHLAKATGDDVVLFYYAGHGAQASAPEAFWPTAPSRMLETIVCYDSRIDKEHWDLADKELAQLIGEVAENNPHIAVVLDCCHSGSGTREGNTAFATRRAEPDRRERPLESFLLSAEAVVEMEKVGTAAGTRSAAPLAASSAVKLPLGRHVVLSACRDIEEAKEHWGDNQVRGAFSYFLQTSLKQANGSLSYRDLFKRTNALIRSNVLAQSPQLAATDVEDLEQPFLGGAIAPTPPYFTVSHHADYGWIIDGGAIHGLQAPNAEETTVLSLFPFDAAPEQMKQMSAAIAQAKITEVMPQLSKLAIDASVDAAETFKSVVVSSPLPPVLVYAMGGSAGVEKLRSAIATSAPNGSPSLYVQLTDAVETADLRVVATAQGYRITSPVDDRPLVSDVEGADESSTARTVENLEHMARWKAIAALASPSNSRVQGAVKLKIYSGAGSSYENAKEITDAQIQLAYEYDERRQAWAAPRFRIKLCNTSNQSLYCALFYLGERFNADVIKPDGVSSLTRLAPGDEVWFANGAALSGDVPDKLWQQGITEIKDILKLIACTDEFDPTLMALPELGLPVDSRAVEGSTRSLTRSLRSGGTLNRLMAKVHTRDIKLVDDAPTYDDWVSEQIAFTFVRPQLSTPIRASETVTLNNALTVAPHPQLAANLRLTTVTQSARDLNGQVVPSLLQNETEPFQFSQSRASDPGLTALELGNVENREAVTAEQPLVLEADTPLSEDEYILPVAYDGEFYLPLGYGKATDGKTRIVIERLTEPVSEGARSVAGSIRIFFRKIVTKKLGKELSQQMGITFEYPLLAAAALTGKKISYSHDVAAIKERVAQAQNIVIYVHGIFGDTESMLPSLDTAVATLGDKTTPIGELYDLVLAFDYENINTSIDRNARLLKARLEAVGLGAAHGKTLHIVAHSMGGLVSRWFIEKAGGSDAVDHLIMLGTPNNGSPWPQVQAGITAAVTFAMNGLSLVVAPLKILEGLLRRIETVDVSLDQMQPGSEFLEEMAIAPDPKVPYTIVVGNTSLIPEDKTASLKKRIVQRLWKAAELPFFNQPNDIAVSVASIVAVPEGRSPAPKQLLTACNHLEYFTNPAGLASLTSAVVGTGISSDVSLGISPGVSPGISTVTSPDRSGERPAPEEKIAKPRAAKPVLWIVVFSVLGLIAMLLFAQRREETPTRVEPVSQQQNR